MLTLVAASFLFSHHSYAMEIAITIDDIPANGNLSTNISRREIADKIINVLQKHHIKNVYGLLNGKKVNEVVDGNIILKKWLNAGHMLGNHTYQHLDLANTDIQDYIADIKKNELALKDLGLNNYLYFRYPYLSEGNTQEKRDQVRTFLFSNGYKIAPVTVDFFEYEWNDPYVRCVNKNDHKAIQWLKKTYIEQAKNAVIIAHELSVMLFGRDIKNILLIHINAFTSEMFDQLLSEYEKLNIKFIALPDALNDPAYQINPNIVRKRAYTFLNQVRLMRGLPNPSIVNDLYDSLPEEKLNNLCKG